MVCVLLLSLPQDLGRNNPKLDLSDIQSLQADPSLSRPLDRAVRQQLEPIWHTLNWRSRWKMLLCTYIHELSECVYPSKEILTAFIHLYMRFKRIHASLHEIQMPFSIYT